MTKPKVYLDMDGVLADFDGALYNEGVIIDRDDNRLMKQHLDKSQWTDKERNTDAKVQVCMSRSGFFRELDIMKGAEKLWAIAGNPIVLTARPKKEDPNNRVCKEKREWITEYFGSIPDDRFICCVRSEKKDYAEGNILVDDLEWNCSEWKKAGGTAIHFKNMEQAIKDLASIVPNATI